MYSDDDLSLVGKFSISRSLAGCAKQEAGVKKWWQNEIDRQSHPLRGRIHTHPPTQNTHKVQRIELNSHKEHDKWMKAQFNKCVSARTPQMECREKENESEFRVAAWCALRFSRNLYLSLWVCVCVLRMFVCPMLCRFITHWNSFCRFLFFLCSRIRIRIHNAWCIIMRNYVLIKYANRGVQTAERLWVREKECIETELNDLENETVPRAYLLAFFNLGNVNERAVLLALLPSLCKNMLVSSTRKNSMNK